MDPNAVESWVARIRDGDRIALSKAITLAESSLPEDRTVALMLLAEAGQSKESLRLAVTGPPGAGKSTLIEALGLELISKGLRVAVLTIDPSSPRTGGSILGDKTRMQQLSAHPNAFVRPSPSQGGSGGVAPRTREAISLAEAAGYQFILIETVGVGQSEYAVVDLADAVLLVTIPGSGDSLQAMKRGILEVADGVLVNKCDGVNRPAAMQARQELEPALSGRFSGLSDEPVRVACCSALTGEGIPELTEFWIRYRDSAWASGRLRHQRFQQAKGRVLHELAGGSVDRLGKLSAALDAMETGLCNEYEILLNALA